ncbi:hypothetical protein [Bradyrhizobium japonicum]|uniref:hypothetical protein n=1 Tax=Bradyrhizobium japonicum TaxID=375 RepID=UPI001E4E2EBD|nr:hypothetical protein [Bradyrhizobium japonicum]MCD9821156.1 hypothetical protein [Bradyrhizobium japonicum]MEB2674147.1 hypothetical protein [Bradyrhizobium japonicum]WRI93333.1 hypothetical protein R3F75_21315 [Bradyrhizobium japonicum]
MSDRGFSHPNLGHAVEIKQQGNRVALIFVCNTGERATELVDDLLRQLRGGALNITLMGKPTGTKEWTE